MNLIDWMVESAAWMRRDRPDLYREYEDAFNDLERVVNELTSQDGPGWTSWGGFFLHKWEEDGVVEWNLMKKVTSADVFIEENEINVSSWTENSGTMTSGVELPYPGNPS